MYAIVNELGVNKDNLMEYEIFGIKLANTKERKMDLLKLREDLKRMKVNPDIINQIDTKIGILFRENDRETSIFTKTNNMNLFNSAKDGRDLYKIIDDFHLDIGYINFKSINPFKPYTSPGVIYEEMLSVAKKYFEGPENMPNKIRLSSKLARFMDVMQNLDLRIYRFTVPKYLTKEQNRCDIAWNSGFLPLLRANALTLMLLTNKTYYVNELGHKVPIVIGGVERKNAEWKEEPQEPVRKRVINYTDNPLIYNDYNNKNTLIESPINRPF